MRNRLRAYILALHAVGLASVWLALTSLAFAQSPISAFPPGTFSNKAALDPPAVPTYQGPGDVVSGATVFGSCARVYTAAQASTSTNLCDLVDSAAPTSVICTLRGSSSGFVDLVGTYCTGSVTPAVKCAAATGGVCNVQKIYDQTGNGNHLTQNTAASQPVLTFSGARSLPGITCTSAASTVMAAGSFTASLPYTFTTVAARTSGTTTQAVLGFVTSPNNFVGFANAANTVMGSLNVGTNLTIGSQTDGSYHAIQFVGDTSPNAVLASDGTESSGNAGTGTPSSNQFRFCRYAGGSSLNGTVMEIGWWSTTGFNGTQRTDMNSNMHGASGYNF